MIAEGGTEYGHMETISRSISPYGPYEPCPANPILTHRSLNNSIQATGHADLVQAADGSWWAVCLGIRPVAYPKRHHLGREVFLAPVHWSDYGWPTIGKSGTIASTMEAPRLPVTVWPSKPTRDDFDEECLGLEWTFLRNPAADSWSLSERQGFLVLHGNRTSLNDAGAPAFVGRRLCHFSCEIGVFLDYEPVTEGEEAGLTVFMNEKYHYDLAVKRVQGMKKVMLRKRVGSLTVEQVQDCDAGPIVLKIKAEPERFLFSCMQHNGVTIELGQGETHLLSTEVAGGFTGVFIAMYATSPAEFSTPAAFDWFDYEPDSTD
ncbi:Beta-xylosidase [compost metagenome]